MTNLGKDTLIEDRRRGQRGKRPATYQAGVDVIVAGNSVFKAKDYKKAIKSCGDKIIYPLRARPSPSKASPLPNGRRRSQIPALTHYLICHRHRSSSRLSLKASTPSAPSARAGTSRLTTILRRVMCNGLNIWGREILSAQKPWPGLLTSVSRLFIRTPAPHSGNCWGRPASEALKHFLPGFYAFRMYAPVLFGMLMALIYLRAAKDWGRLAAIASVLFAVLMPRLFTDGHIGATETPLCFFWFLTVMAFEASFESGSWPCLPASASAWPCPSSSPGFCPRPFWSWALIYHRRKILLPASGLLLIGPLVFVLLQPSIWHHPLHGFAFFGFASRAKE